MVVDHNAAAQRFYNAVTGKASKSLTTAEKEALSAALELICAGLDSLHRIAGALEAQQPARPSEDPTHGL